MDSLLDSDNPDDFFVRMTDEEFRAYMDSFPDPVVIPYPPGTEYEDIYNKPWPGSLESRRWYNDFYDYPED